MNVAVIIFNRPDLTERVCTEVAQARPDQVFVIADGPRRDRPEDVRLCAAARAVIDHIDWPCPVHKNYAEHNLGCGQRPATGISWVFEQVDRAIILEDDCLPDPSFFPFCAELLDRYAEDERVVQVSGNLHHFGEPRGEDSYFFSRHNVCAGGWATWRRAWRHFDINIDAWPALRDTGWLCYSSGDARVEEFWQPLFDAAAEGKGNVSFWDYQWTFACWLQNGLSATPNVGLISNLGFRPDGTHTKRPSRWANLPTATMQFPLRHPPHVIPHAEADQFFVDQLFVTKRRLPLVRRVHQRVRRKLSAGFHAVGTLFS